MKRWGYCCWGVIFLLTSGCASYQSQVKEARNSIKSRQFSLAANQLKPLAEAQTDDQLVYLLDYGMALHLAEDFAQSNQVFLRAVQLAEAKDYHSVSRITGSLVFNEGFVQYKGDTYEKLLIHVYLALNYLFLNDLENSLVEIRRLDELLSKFQVEMKKKYQQNSFARYLSAIIWEGSRKWDDSYIDFKKTWNIDPSIGLLQKDLLRSSYKAQRFSEYRKWKKKICWSSRRA